jgi:ATPase family associated with various cellular activities (AAA)
MKLDPGTFNFATDDYATFAAAVFYDNRLRQGLSTHCKEINITVDQSALLDHLDSTFKIHMINSDVFALSNDGKIYLTISDKKWALKIMVYGDADAIEEISKDLNDTFENNPCFIRWIYDPQYLESVKMPVNTHHMPLQEMYPFLNESIESYYDRFMKSSANILVLIGCPGSGKTTLIRGLLAHTKKSATLTYHQKVLEQDSFFVEWLQSSDTFMILEDSDSLLLPRADGNDLMARFLNMGDGLMAFKNKKIIFSTNLPNISDIDSALTRPGRCFDILEFGQLNREEAQKLASKVGVELHEGKQFTVSEIFASLKNEAINRPKSKVGFFA